MKKSLFLLVVLFFVFSFNDYAQVQNDTLREKAIKVYFDCYFCDMDFIRREITYVNYVRDRKEADVVILGTSMSTGSGGTEYTLTFIGYNKFNGINDTLTYDAKPDATKDEKRKGLLKILQMGLLRYIIHSPYADKLELSMKDENVENNAEDKEVIDKWKNWVFRIGASGWFNGEATSRNISGNGYINADKVTKSIKINTKLEVSYNENKYSYGDFNYLTIIRNMGYRSLVVFSLGEHWSAGGSVSAGTNTYNNKEMYASISPGIEYDVFKYSEATHHQLRLLYKIGYDYNKYIDTTIYNKIEEGYPTHQLNVAFEVVKPWGSISTTMWAVQYLHDMNFYNIGVWGYMRFRIFKGFSTYMNFSSSIIHNQIYLAKDDYSIEDLLTNSKSMPTNYSYYMSIGVSYTFGSVYNNVVNPRFD